MKITCLLGFSMLFLMQVSQASYANLITNGSFESGLAGWTAIDFAGGSVGFGGTEGATDGALAAIFNGGNLLGGTLSQSFGTTIGGAYQLDFDYGVFGAANFHDFQIEILGNSIFSQSIGKTGPNSFDPNQTNFSNFGFDFVADSSSTTIRFTDFTTLANSSSSDSLVDNVSVNSVNSVPAPAIVWLIGAGFVGLIGMKKKSKSCRAG